MADLSAATVQDVSDFFHMYYAPNNAIVAIVGDVDAKATLEKVKKYFGGIARQPTPPAVDMSEPPQTEERRATLDDPLARLPRLDMAYHVPAGSSPDYDALSVLSTILSSGRSSRFYESIVRQQQLAANAFAGVAESRGPGLFSVSATPRPGNPSPNSRRPSTRVREGEKRTDRRLGARESPVAARQLRRSLGGSLAARSRCRRTRCSTTIRTCCQAPGAHREGHRCDISVSRSCIS
jgi:hypothetical protein